MNYRMLLSAVLLVLPLQGIAQDKSGEAAKGPRAAKHEACKADPEKCRAEAEARRAQCKVDPEKCRQEFQAKREKMCAQNPEKCKEMKARMEERRAQCKADPKKCEQERQAKMDQRFKKADSDGSGALSRAEAEQGMPMLAKNFDHVDANKDGQVTRDELAAARKKQGESRGQKK